MRVRLYLYTPSPGRPGTWRSEDHADLPSALATWFSLPLRARKGGYLADAAGGPVRMPHSWEMKGGPLLTTRHLAHVHGKVLSTVAPPAKLNAEYLIVRAVASGSGWLDPRKPLSQPGMGGLEEDKPETSTGPGPAEILDAEWVEAPEPPRAPLRLPPPPLRGRAAARHALASASCMASAAGPAWQSLHEAASSLAFDEMASASDVAHALVRLASGLPDSFADGPTASEWAMAWRPTWQRAAVEIVIDEPRAETLFVMVIDRPAGKGPSTPVLAEMAAYRPAPEPMASLSVSRPPRASHAPTALGRTVLKALAGRGPMRKAQVAALVGVGRGSANRIVDTLVRSGHLSEPDSGRYCLAQPARG